MMSELSDEDIAAPCVVALSDELLADAPPPFGELKRLSGTIVRITEEAGMLRFAVLAKETTAFDILSVIANTPEKERDSLAIRQMLQPYRTLPELCR